MGKRSEFERRPRDFYPTPLAAVRPLLPHLNGTKRFAEPCVGDGDLMNHLEANGLECVYSGDIADDRDALAFVDYGEIDAIITNPPHTREILHKMIVHFQQVAPTWLLIDLDWAANAHSVPFLPYCSDIVVIGRVKWIENSKHTGKENYAWYRFDGNNQDMTCFHNLRGQE
jgi:hypothetical protein